MSLIEEALRRVQDPAAPPPPAAAEAAKPQAAHSWSVAPVAGARSTDALRPVAAGILLAGVAAAIAAALWWSRTAPSATGAPSAVAPAGAAAPSAVQPATSGPAAAAAPKEGLVLSGVVLGGGEPYAVINGVIVALGEQIEGATLERVEEGAAILRGRKGETMTLRVPR
jgi:hypothetical protein